MLFTAPSTEKFLNTLAAQSMCCFFVCTKLQNAPPSMLQKVGMHQQNSGRQITISKYKSGNCSTTDGTYFISPSSL